MARRADREKTPERRRRLAEQNLLSEPRTKAAGTRRGCALLPLLILALSATGLALPLLGGRL